MAYADISSLACLQVDEFTAWLNPKGNRELALRNTLTKWWPHIVPGIRKRLSVSGLLGVSTVRSLEGSYALIRAESNVIHVGFEQYSETSGSSPKYTCQAGWRYGYLAGSLYDMDKPQSSEHVVAVHLANKHTRCTHFLRH